MANTLMCTERMDSRRAEHDPVIFTDERVLHNLLISESFSMINIDYFAAVQQDITGHMRRIVVNWMMEVCEELGCENQVFPLAVRIMDHFLTRCSMKRQNLQLLGAVCLNVASKFRQVQPISSETLIYYTDNSVTTQDMLRVEMMLLLELKWNVSLVTPSDFVEHVLSRVPWANESPLLRRHAHLLLQLCCAVWPMVESATRWSTCTEGPCRCRPETRSLNCWQLELSELPTSQAVPRDVRVIDLGVNHLSAIHKNAFQGLSYLMELDLFDNQIDHLPSTLFADLESLTHLRLHRNRIEELPERLLLRLINLSTLDLSSNALRELPKNVFEGLSRLVVLHMSDNRLTALPKLSGLLTLEDLDLSSNKLSEIPETTFRGLQNLQWLRLHDNQMTSLPADLFTDLVSLRHLTLYRNRLAILPPKLFAPLLNLTYLELANNWLTSLHPTDFEHQTELRELHLGQNRLESIPEGAFESAVSLERLFLFSNNLEQLEGLALRGLRNLTSLMLNNNLLRSIHQDAFQHVPNLRKLQLDSNKLHFLSTGCLEPLTKLVSVKLAKNPWHCDCSILYLSRWLRENKRKVWDSNPACRGPGDFGGKHIEEMTFEDLCEGQWASMTRFSHRVPISKQETVIVQPDANIQGTQDATHSVTLHRW